MRINVGEEKTNDKLWVYLEENKYPVFEINVEGIESIGGIMLGLQRAVAIVAYLWDICFVDQPAVEGYKNATRDVMSQLQPGEKVGVPAGWRYSSFNSIRLYYDRLIEVNAFSEGELRKEVNRLGATMNDAPAVYAAIINLLSSKPDFEAKELTSYGRMTESFKEILEGVRNRIFTDGLKMPSKLGEGPDKNHSYQQNIEDGRDVWFSTYFMPLEVEQPEALEYDDNLIKAQTIGTVNSIVNQGRKVALIAFDSTTREAEIDLSLFFKEAENYLKSEGIELARSSRRQEVDSKDQIIAVLASSIIINKEGFENWLLAQAENIAVVIIAMDDYEYNEVSKYKDIAYIKEVGRDIGEAHSLKLIEIFALFGKSEFFDGFKLGTPYSIDEYKVVLDGVASGV